MKTAPALVPPITAAELPEDWIAARREIIALGRYPVQAGADHTIEIRSTTPPAHLSDHDRLKMNPWCTLILPNNAPGFATAAERDAVLAALKGAA